MKQAKGKEREKKEQETRAPRHQQDLEKARWKEKVPQAKASDLK